MKHDPYQSMHISHYSHIDFISTLVHENSTTLSTALELSDGFAARQVRLVQKSILFFSLFVLANRASGATVQR